MFPSWTYSKELKDWIELHIKQRDLITKAITSIGHDSQFDLIARRTDEDHFFIIRPDLSDFKEIAKKSEGRKLGIVTLNTKKNVKSLADNWNKVKDKDKLCFYFLNPSTDEKWMIFPKVHDLVTEPQTLKASLQSLHESITSFE